MVHFLRQIQAYCQLEVIECSWSDLVDFLAKREGDMDSLIKAHKTYLDRIVRKVLLLGSGSRGEKEEVLLDQVRDAMDCILQFRDATVSCDSSSIERRADVRTSCTLGLFPKRRG